MTKWSGAQENTAVSGRCAECDQPLSKHAEKRETDEIGRPVHPGCLTFESRLLRDIFGRPGGPRKAAEMAGHQITESRTDDQRYRWQCSCGVGATLTSGVARKADVRQHQAMAIFD